MASLGGEVKIDTLSTDATDSFIQSRYGRKYYTITGVLENITEHKS